MTALGGSLAFILVFALIFPKHIGHWLGEIERLDRAALQRGGDHV